MREILGFLFQDRSVTKYEKAFKSLLRKASDSKDTVPVIRLLSEPGRSIEIPANIQESLNAVTDSKNVTVCEAAFTPSTIFMVAKTKDSDSPRIFGIVFNLKERRFFTRDLIAIKDGESVAPLLEPTGTRKNSRSITKDGILELTSFIEDISQRQNVRYSLHSENPMELYSRYRRYFVTTESVAKGGD